MKPVFVGGCPRSGTTLLKRMLDAHSEMYCGPEFGHLPALCERYALMKKGVETGRIDQYFDSDTLRNKFSHFVSDLIISPRDDGKLRRVAEKTPDNVLWFRELFDLFPDAYFLHIIRHPLDVVASYKRVADRAREEGQQLPDSSALASVENAARKWVSSVSSINRQGLAEDPRFQERYLELKYEDLVRYPAYSAADLCSFLEIDFSGNMIELDRKLEGDSSNFGGVFYVESEYRSSITDSNVGGWRRSLDPEEIKSATPILARLARVHGYYGDHGWV